MTQAGVLRSSSIGPLYDSLCGYLSASSTSLIQRSHRLVTGIASHSSFTEICLCVCTWTRVSAHRRLLIYSVHWPGVEVQRKCLPSLLHHSGVQYTLFQPWPESNLKITKRGKCTSLTLSTPLHSSPALPFFLPEMTNNLQKDHGAITRGETEHFTRSGAWLGGSLSVLVYIKCMARRREVRLIICA